MYFDFESKEKTCSFKKYFIIGKSLCLRKKKQFWLHKYSTTLGRVSLVSTLRFTHSLPTITWKKGKQSENGFVSGNFRYVTMGAVSDRFALRF